MEATKTINDQLLALDRKHRLNYEDETTIAVRDGIVCIMEDLVQKIGEIEPIFKGSLQMSGSMRNKTKIGKPDEIDFGFHWDLSDSRDPMITEVVFHVPEEPKTPYTILLKDQVKMYFYIDKANQCLERFSIKDATPFIEPEYMRDGFYVYEINEMQRYFTNVVDYIMEQLMLPKGWSHGGYNSPEYSGYRGTGASTMFQFIFNDEVTAQPLPVSVDFVMLIELRECYKDDPFELLEKCGSNPTWLKEYLKNHSCYDKVWLKFDGGNSLTDHSLAIRQWLENFDMESPLKTVIRVVKCLSKLAFTFPTTDQLENLPDNFLTEIVWKQMYDAREHKKKYSEYDTNLQKKTSLRAFQKYDICKPEGSKFADIGEQIDCPPYVKSYTMLVLILSMFCAKANKHPDLELGDIWKLDDVDSIVTHVLTLLMKSVQSGVATLKDADGRELLGRLSANDMYTKNTVVDYINQMIKIKS